MNLDHELWLERNKPTAAQWADLADRAQKLPHKPLLSIILLASSEPVPLAETTVRSLLLQLYSNWELCVVGDSVVFAAVAELTAKSAAPNQCWHVGANDAAESDLGLNEALRAVRGDYIAYMSAGDILSADALCYLAEEIRDGDYADLIYCDEDSISTCGGIRETPFFKPDWCPDLLLSMNYIGNFFMVKTSLVRRLEGVRAGFADAALYDLLLRVTELTGKTAHVPRLLFSRRRPDDSPSTARRREEEHERGAAAIEDAMRRRDLRADVRRLHYPCYDVRYHVRGNPLVSIIIPVKDRFYGLRQCVESIRRKTAYKNYEIIVVDCAPPDEDEEEDGPGKPLVEDGLRVLRWIWSRNLSQIYNWAAGAAKGDYILFLRDDVDIPSEDWLDVLLGQAQRDGVGAVAPKIVLPGGRIKATGLILGIAGISSAFDGLETETHCYFGMAHLTRNYSALPISCVLIPRLLFARVEGFDEGMGPTTGMTDLCCRIRRSELVLVSVPAVAMRLLDEKDWPDDEPADNGYRFYMKWWPHMVHGDRYFNRNLTANRPDFFPRIDVTLRREQRFLDKTRRRWLPFAGVPRIVAFPRDAPLGEGSPEAQDICDLAVSDRRVWWVMVVLVAATLAAPGAFLLLEFGDSPVHLRLLLAALVAASGAALSALLVQEALDAHLSAHMSLGPPAYSRFTPPLKYHDLRWPVVGGVEFELKCQVWRSMGHLSSCGLWHRLALGGFGAVLVLETMIGLRAGSPIFWIGDLAAQAAAVVLAARLVRETIAALSASEMEPVELRKPWSTAPAASAPECSPRPSENPR